MRVNLRHEKGCSGATKIIHLPHLTDRVSAPATAPRMRPQHEHQLAEMNIKVRSGSMGQGHGQHPSE